MYNVQFLFCHFTIFLFPVFDYRSYRGELEGGSPIGGSWKGAK